ncbi:phosphotransferase [Polaromonas sp.]|uniref:aminoglycoside phosphotransferase family protein n=1 Tax=Polaromonas sp. TaxID=1869339 RepID=UPI00179297A4|nr:phosphotransferase [Polaromonas sp.]NML84885.1 phosphotransferase [Polaromonas sp.]
MTASPLVWTDPARASAFAQWLASIAQQHGLQTASVRLASADASFRRYFRIDAAGGSCIIMDAPPDREDCAPFVKVAALMADAGLNAPRVLAWNAPLGFMLLSDLGAKTLLELIAPPLAVSAMAVPTPGHFDLYMEAVDLLVRWQLASKPGVLPPYDDALLSRELALFPEWYVGRHRSIRLDAGQQGKLDDAFAQIKASNLQSLGGARVYVHRDFMPRNLMVAQTSNAEGVRFFDEPPLGKLAPPGGSAAHEVASVGALGILDFQDAVYGPITYDIASLMRDAFLSWEEEFVLDITVRYWQKARKAGLPVGDDFGEFYRAVEWMGLQRHLKVLGIFARLTLRDGKPHYLADTPRFIRYVRATCARYRQLGPLMVLLDEIEGNETRVGYTF